MKLNFALVLAAGLLGGSFLAHHQLGLVHAQSPTTSQGKLHLEDTFTARGQAVIMTADNIERDASTIRLKGNVEITLRPSSPNVDVMVLRADEAEYRKQSDEIVPRGNVRLAIEKPR